MPIKNGVGYGEHTPLKVSHLQAILKMHVSISMAVMAKHRYWRQTYHYIDATAGPGKCPDFNLPGSPLTFLEIAEEKELRCRCDFIEILQDNCDELGHNTAQCSNLDGVVKIHCADYTERLIEVVASDRNQIGLVFVDPSGDCPDFESVGKALDQCPRMEVLFYLAPAPLKRNYHNTKMKLVDHLKLIPRSKWLIREPAGRHQWTFLLGSNSSLFSNYKKIGFYKLDSDKGQAVFNVLNLTKNELKHLAQLSFF